MGISKFSVGKILSHSTEKFIEEPFGLPEGFGERKNLCKRGVHYDLLSQIFCLIVPTNILEEPICVSDGFWYQKLSRNRGEWRLSRFSVENVLSHKTENYS